MSITPDFDALKRERAAAIARDMEKIRSFAAEMFGCEPGEVIPAHVYTPGQTEDCYCGCIDGGPCQHEFAGWREFEDGRGGEQFCQRCGLGAMSHSLAVCWD